MTLRHWMGLTIPEGLRSGWPMQDLDKIRKRTLGILQAERAAGLDNVQRAQRSAWNSANLLHQLSKAKLAGVAPTVESLGFDELTDSEDSVAVSVGDTTYNIQQPQASGLGKKALLGGLAAAALLGPFAGAGVQRFLGSMPPAAVAPDSGGGATDTDTRIRILPDDTP